MAVSIKELTTEHSNRSEHPVPLHTFTDPFYNALYNGFGREKSDSPDKSRIRLVRSARKYITRLTKKDFILDLGSGPQIFERQYFQANRDPRYKPQAKFITVDRVHIDASNLLLEESNKVKHTRASGEKLPFQDDTFSFVVSNMALDFMSPSALAELLRVMKTRTHALVRLHHPKLYLDNPEDILDNPWIPKSEKDPVRFWEELRKRNALTSDQNEVYRRFILAGFDVKDLRLVKDHKDAWWELDLVKTPIDKLFSRRAGRLMSKIIAKRKNQKTVADSIDMKQLAYRFNDLDTTPRDPSNPNKKIDFKTLIAKIDTGKI